MSPISRWNNDIDGNLQASPASFGLPNIIAVAAVDGNDVLADFSNYGGSTVHIAAPGVSIGTTTPVFLDPDNLGPYIAGLNGTSFATPFVTGTAALMLEGNPTLSYAQLKEAILNNVDLVPSLAGKVVSGGRLNVYKALAAVSATSASSTASASSMTFNTRFGAVPITPQSAFAALESETSELVAV